MRTYYCRKRGCFCGREIYFKTIDGRRVPFHKDEIDRPPEARRPPMR